MHSTLMIKRALLSAALSAALAPSLAQAQREVTSAIEEITVTAQKREESAQDIPVAVTALDAEALEKTFARDLLDVTGMSPNLIIDPILGNGTAAISIRGMQLNDVEKSFDPAVAVYMDGIYLATTTGALLQIWDSEAVEVLRGPQGTLFGRNTIGGLVHVRRKKPSGEFGGRVTATVGRYERVDLNATVNSDSFANDTLSFKGTVMYQDGGGYFNNAVRGTDEGDTDFLGLSGMLLWEPTDTFSAWLSVDRFDDDTPTRPVTSLTQAGEVFDGFCGTLGLCGGIPADEDYHRNPTTTLNQQAFVETTAVTLNAEWDLDDRNSFYLVAGWRDTEEDAIQEFDGIGADAPGFPLDGNFFWTQRPQELDQPASSFAGTVTGRMAALRRLPVSTSWTSIIRWINAPRPCCSLAHLGPKVSAAYSIPRPSFDRRPQRGRHSARSIGNSTIAGCSALAGASPMRRRKPAAINVSILTA